MMPDLGEQLRSHIDAAAAPIQIDEIVTSRSASLGRRGRFVALTASVVAVIGLALALLPAGDGDGHRVDAGGRASTAGPVPWTPSLGSEVPAPPIPEGWKVLEVGAYRLAVPRAWTVPYSATCAFGPTSPDGMVLIPAARATGGCEPEQPRPVSVISFGHLDVSADSSTARTDVTVGTVAAVEYTNLTGCSDCGRVFLLPDGTSLSASGPEADAVLATLTDAGALRALQAGPLLDTGGWQPVTYADVQFDAPPGWEIVDLPAFTETTNADGSSAGVSGQVSPGVCGPMFPAPQPPRVSLGGSQSNFFCPAQFEFGIDGGGDGAWIRDVAGGREGTTVARATIGGLDVRVVRFDDQPGVPVDPALELLITTPTGDLHLSLGVGVDAAVARTILSTLRTTNAVAGSTTTRAP